MTDETAAPADVAAAPTTDTSLTVTSNIAADATTAPSDATQTTPDGEVKPEAKEGEDKPADAETKPIEYTDFKLPEGMTLDEKLITDFKEFATENNLSQEDAQKLIDLHANTLKEAAEAPYKAWATTQQQWQKDVMADTELGGQNFEPMKVVLAKAIDQVGGEQAKAIREALNFTGAGNNPDILRLIFRMGKAITEGSPTSTGGPTNVSKPKSAGEIMYPSMTGLANQNM